MFAPGSAMFTLSGWTSVAFALVLLAALSLAFVVLFRKVRSSSLGVAAEKNAALRAVEPGVVVVRASSMSHGARPAALGVNSDVAGLPVPLASPISLVCADARVSVKSANPLQHALHAASVGQLSLAAVHELEDDGNAWSDDAAETGEPNVYRMSRDFVPSNDDELHVSQGDVIVVLERFSDGWLLASNEGMEGVVPSVLCEPVIGKLVLDFVGQEEDELSLNAGARVQVMEYFDDGWALVRSLVADENDETAHDDSRTGFVPQDFIDDSLCE